MGAKPGRPYQGKGITVFYDLERCVHFAECVRETRMAVCGCGRTSRSPLCDNTCRDG